MGKERYVLPNRPFMRASAINCRWLIQSILKEDIYKMATKLKGLDVGSTIISGNRAMVGEMLSEHVNLGDFSSGNIVSAKGTIGGCDFTIRGLESEMESIIGLIRPYPGSGPVKVGHTYRGIHSGEIATAIFASKHNIVSRYPDGAEFSCLASQFKHHFKAIIDQKSMLDLTEDLNHYRGRVPDSLIDECLKLVKEFK